MGRPSLLRDLLKILTPEEIDDLSKIYLSLYRKSLTSLMEKRLNQELVEKGIDLKEYPPPVSKIAPSRPEVRDVRPPIIGKEEVVGGASFYLEEREKFKGSFEKQKKIHSSYGKGKKLAEKLSRGLLVNKKAA